MSAPRPISRAHLLRTVVPAATACAVLGPRIAFASEDANPMNGVFRFAGGKKQEEALSAAIEDVVSQLNFMIRGIARARLQRGLEPKPMLGLEFDQDKFRLTTPGMPRLVGPYDGRPFSYKNHEGKTVKVRIRVDGRNLHARYVGDGGDSRYVYRFDTDGGRFDLCGAIDHVRMPDTIRYRLTYARA